MKARPVRMVGEAGNRRHEQCAPDEATHVMINPPAGFGLCALPIGRDGWTWNKSVTKPTLTPSVKHHREGFCDHFFVNEGKVQYLGDCTHEARGKTLELDDL